MISAQKARLVADQIRGQKIDQALNILAFSEKKAAHLVKKVLETLKGMLESQKEKYIGFWKEFGPFLKQGLYSLEEKDRKVLADLAVHDPAGFAAIFNKVKAALA